jgi:hypothetical protein
MGAGARMVPVEAMGLAAGPRAAQVATAEAVDPRGSRVVVRLAVVP